MKKLLLISCLMVSVCQADVLGLSADTAYWLPHVQSQTANQSTQNHQGQIMASASFEHFVPLVPNARLRYTALPKPTTSSYTPTSSNGSVTDFIAYYKLLDSFIALDVGVGVQKLHDGTQPKSQMSLPMIYTTFGLDLPLTNLSANTELAFAKNRKHQSLDTLAELSYRLYNTSMIDVDGKVGYRVMNIKHPNDETVMQGIYAGIKAKF